jgi:hypothetical protein
MSNIPSDAELLEYLINSAHDISAQRYCGLGYGIGVRLVHGTDINPKMIRQEIIKQYNRSKEKHYLVWRGGAGGDSENVPESQLSDAERKNLIAYIQQNTKE